MRGLRIAAVLVAATFMLAACATPEIPYDKTVAAQVKTIGIVTPHFPDGPSVVLASSVGQSFGLIGALIDAGMRANRESQFKTLLLSQNYSIPDAFIKSLSDGLQAEGYTVSLIPVMRDRADFLAHYPPAQVDAYLDVVTLGYGYIAAGISSSLPYRPIFLARARLVKAQDSSVLMQDAVYYNPYGPATKVVTIPPDADKQFVDFDSLMADPVNAVGWLHYATDRSAQTINNLLNPAL
jgi:hypothetical protein